MFLMPAFLALIFVWGFMYRPVDRKWKALVVGVLTLSLALEFIPFLKTPSAIPLALQLLLILVLFRYFQVSL